MALESIPFDRFAPEYTRSEYSATDALSFCLASQLAYSSAANSGIDTTQISSVLKEWGFPVVNTFEIVRGRDIDTQGFVAINDSHVLAAFRGTESLPDWLTNLQVVKDPGPWPKTKVHEGFQDAFLVSALKIGDIIGRERSANQQIWLTGHSLGGALAVLLAATLFENGIDVHGLYTFGAPRVGNKQFAKALNERLDGKAHWRVVNRDDIVPHVPLESFFCHAGNRKLLLDDETISNSARDWNDFKESIWGWIGRQLGRRKLKIADPHRLNSETGYLHRLAAHCDAQTAAQ